MVLVAALLSLALVWGAWLGAGPLLLPNPTWQNPDWSVSIFFRGSLTKIGPLYIMSASLQLRYTELSVTMNCRVWGLLLAAGPASAQLTGPVSTLLCLRRSPRLAAAVAGLATALAWLFTSFASRPHQVQFFIHGTIFTTLRIFP